MDSSDVVTFQSSSFRFSIDVERTSAGVPVRVAFRCQRTGQFLDFQRREIQALIFSDVWDVYGSGAYYAEATSSPLSLLNEVLLWFGGSERTPFDFSPPPF